jgi:hypothetical protein
MYKDTAKLFKFQILLMVMCSTAAAQVLPDAPKPKIDKLEWTLLAADAGARGLDVYSTHVFLEHGDHEVVLPAALVKHSAVFAVFSGGIVFGQYEAAKLLTRHHKRWIAYLLTAADVGMEVDTGVENLRLKRWK